MAFQSSLQADTLPTKAEITKLYVASFKRAPDAGGLQYWFNTRLTLKEIATYFFDSPEMQEEYPPGSTTQDFVEAVYLNLFNRPSDPGGLAYWVNVIDKGWITRADLILYAIDTDSDSDAVILANKTEVGLAFATAGLSDPDDTRDIMADITDNRSTVFAALRTIEEKSSIIHEVTNIAEFRKALEDSALNCSSDVIILDKGVYDTTSDGEGTFAFADTEGYNLTVRAKDGLSKEDVVLDGNHKSTVFDIRITNSKSVFFLENVTLVQGTEKLSTGGYANGGGIYTINSLMLKNVKIYFSGAGYGGAIYMNSLSQDSEKYFMRIEDSNISNNTSVNTGGAIVAYNIGKVELVNTIISGNKALLTGSKILDLRVSELVTVDNCTISNNISEKNGIFDTINIHVKKSEISNNQSSGWYLLRGSNIIMEDSIIKNNTTRYSGIISASTNTISWKDTKMSVFKRNKFLNNQVRDYQVLHHGAFDFGDSILVNNLFQNNLTDDGNHAMVTLASGYVVNNTFYQNTDTAWHINGVLGFGGTIINTIFNDEEVTNEILFSSDSNLYNSYVDYAKLSGTYTVIKKDNKKPSYGDISMTDNGELQSDSIAIDTGLNPESAKFKELIGNDADYQVILDALKTDLLGNSRIVNGVIDMGAIEYR